MATNYFMGLECEGFGIVVDKRLYDAASEEVFPVEGYDIEQLVTAYFVDRDKIYNGESYEVLCDYLEQNGAGEGIYVHTDSFQRADCRLQCIDKRKFLI